MRSTTLTELPLPYSASKLWFLIKLFWSITLRSRISIPTLWVVCRFWCITYAGLKEKNVQQNDKLFDPSQIDARGRTKLQRMKQGLAPVGYDGKSVNLHHIDQTNASDILEISATQYHADYSKLHTNTGQSASLINRSDFSKWRSRYWQFRAEDFLKA